MILVVVHLHHHQLRQKNQDAIFLWQAKLSTDKDTLRLQ